MKTILMYGEGAEKHFLNIKPGRNLTQLKRFFTAGNRVI